MSSRNHTCNCYDCVEGREARNEVRWGGSDWQTNYDDLVPYKKKRRKAFPKKKRPCAKSKIGEQCDFTVPIEKHPWTRDGWTNYWIIYTCSRCGKHGHYSFGHRRPAQIGDTPYGPK